MSDPAPTHTYPHHALTPIQERVLSAGAADLAVAALAAGRPAEAAAAALGLLFSLACAQGGQARRGSLVGRVLPCRVPPCSCACGRVGVRICAPLGLPLSACKHRGSPFSAGAGICYSKERIAERAVAASCRREQGLRLRSFCLVRLFLSLSLSQEYLARAGALHAVVGAMAAHPSETLIQARAGYLP